MRYRVSDELHLSDLRIAHFYGKATKKLREAEKILEGAKLLATAKQSGTQGA